MKREGSKGLQRVRALRLGSTQVVVSMPDETAAKISESRVYKKVIRPFAAWGYHRLARRPGSNGHSNGPGYAPATLSQTAPRPEDVDPKARQIIEKIVNVEWYHSIDLGRGVVTQGFVDHRSQVSEYGIPQSLAGLRCLDVATWDGFWAFEMERRGAAEVVALDVGSWADCDIPEVLREDLIRLGAGRPTGAGFRIAEEVLGSKVQRTISSVYDLSPERVGKFDFIFLSDLLLHLRDPQKALERLRSVCRGSIIVADVFNPMLERYGDLCLSQFVGRIPSEVWWLPNTNTLKMMMRIAGFEPIEEVRRLVLNVRGSATCHKVVLRGHIPDTPSWKNWLPSAEEARERSMGWESQAWHVPPDGGIPFE